MENTIEIKISKWMEGYGANPHVSGMLAILIILASIVILAYLSDFITRKIIVSFIARFAKKSKTEWDDILLQKRVFHRLSHLVPAMVIHYSLSIFIPGFPVTISVIQTGIYVYMIIIGLLVTESFLAALHEIYLTLPISHSRPIKGYIQVVKIFIYFIGGIIILSILLGKNPSTLLAGLGALAAVLLLVFKDTILGFVASIQLSANQMVKPGDWITMPSNNADGIVLEITLNTVKIQNWDKTITTVPTYSLVSDSFYNWKGVEESGVRRIKRYVNIDIKSIKFCTPEMLVKFKKIHLLTDYIVNKQKEINEHNKALNIDDSVCVNGRRLTNIGVFRTYIEEYLKQNPKINKEMAFSVRQLQSTEVGLPLEIYVFSSDPQWDNYERMQSDIFEHIFAVVPEFELNVFQNPTGNDFIRIK